MSCDMVGGTKRFSDIAWIRLHSCGEKLLGTEARLFYGRFDGGLDMLAMVGSEAASWAELNKQI